ncbi:MAG TPA: hypothetical protein VNA12_09655 [Mycobacteriales bacterium]|nr:hypothetical protein [Mycobacteriales bacterium]
MRARAVLPVLATLTTLLVAPAWAHHDCGNEKSQDKKEREACEKAREERKREREREVRERGRSGKDAKGGKGGKGGQYTPPPPPREEWNEVETARTELRVAVSAELVADWVPNRYQVALSGGKATVFITARTFQGEGGVTTVLHEASVAITAPDRSAGVHSYLLWQVTDAPWLAKKLERVGLPMHQLSAPYTSTSAGLAAQVRASVSLGDVVYSFEGSVQESAGASTGTPTVIWYDGFLGTVRAGTTCTTACGTPAQGVVVLSAEPDSRVGAYMSAEVAITPVSFVRSTGTTVAVVVG